MTNRRDFVRTSLLAGATALVRPTAPAIVTSERQRPQLPSGIQVGDVMHDRAIIWGRSDRPARMHLEWSTTERFTNLRRLTSPVTSGTSAFTTHLDVGGLPPGQTIWYRVRYESEGAPGASSEAIVGSFRTPSHRADRPVRVAWSGDMVGQGWGIDEARGGIRMYETLRRAEPDVFVHSGDNIYADGPLQSEVALDDGTVWRNLVTEAKSKVAETLDEFRGNYAYTLLDAHARRFGASVPLIAQWDDHEVVNNWFPELELTSDARFTEKRVRVLAERAKQALFEFLPIRRSGDRLYRRCSSGPLLEIFVVDLRSYRGRNSPNVQTMRSEDAAILGATQLDWLRASLRASTAVWKVVASDMPIGLVVADADRDGQRNYEGIANANDGQPLGRELEIAALLGDMQRDRVRNVVWITADVHYCAAHHYSPERARFTAFDPFWEFVAGPMHAGTFGPNALDATFGPEVRFARSAPKPNRPPSDNLQFFGQLDVDPRTRRLTAALYDVTGARLWSTELEPANTR